MRFAYLLIALGACAFPAHAERIAVIAHRGEHLRNPENTMPAFVEAVRVRADYIEVDVRTTSDGKLVLMHDRNVDRTTNGVGDVAGMTFEQIGALDAGIRRGPAFAGTKVPTFGEALAFARGKIGVYVDVKDASAKAVVEHIHKHGLSENVVIYGGGGLAKQILDLDPRLKVMPEARSAETARRLIGELRLKVMAFDAGDFKPEIIEIAKRAGVLVFVDRLGTADNPAAWRQAVEWGADGIQTDRPEELVRFLREPH